MYNPLDIAGANRRHVNQSANMPRARRRPRIGVEINQSAWCASTGQYYDPIRETCPTSGGSGPGGGSWGPGTPYNPGGGGSGGGTPYTPLTPGGHGFPGGGGTPPVISTVPSGSGTPPVISTVPYNPQCPPGSCAPVIPVCPENQKRWTLPFVPDTGFTEVVLAGATVRFVAFPQGLFIGERLIVPSTIGPYFNIVDFRIANKPQTMASGEVPADMYSEVSTLDTMKYDQAYPGIQVVLTARNKSAISQTFQCSLSGWAVG